LEIFEKRKTVSTGPSKLALQRQRGLLTHVATRVPVAVWVTLLWAIAVLPNLSVRSFVWEEGRNAEIARDILKRGDFLEPYIYGVRWAEKPSLLPWLIAATARVTGGVDEWSARLPPMLAVLFTALLVERLTRRYARARASLFAAVSFLFCPMLLQKLTIAEPDTIITFLSFAAFMVWWRGEEAGRVAAWRWLACGVLLAVLTMAKGPQPAAFFVLGVGGYLIVHHRWATPGLAVCLALPAMATIAWAAAVYRDGDLPVWLTYMRLRVQFDFLNYLRQQMWLIGNLWVQLLPSTILLPLFLSAWRRRISGAIVIPVIEPLILYAGLGLVVLVVWPSANARYAMPAAPAVAVLAGYSIDLLRHRSRLAVRAATTLVGILFAYQVVLITVVMPLFADRFGASRNAGVTLDRAIRAAPGPAMTIGEFHTNQLFYVTWPIRRVDDPSDAAIIPPAWLLAPTARIVQIARARPDLTIHVVVETSSGPALVGARIERRP
jgi:4-amino-4-deoxy-L-arabinose transferase-like glycosyltransferase